MVDCKKEINIFITSFVLHEWRFKMHCLLIYEFNLFKSAAFEIVIYFLISKWLNTVYFLPYLELHFRLVLEAEFRYKFIFF